MLEQHAHTLAILIKLAWRNLWRNYRRTLIMLAAIVLGVWAMILFSAMMRGMLGEMVDAGLRALPGEVQIHHLEYRDDPSIANSISPPAGKLLSALNSPPITAWTSRVKVPGMVSSERGNRGVLLLGVDPAGEIALGFNTQDIVQGRFIESTEDKGIVIGQKLADRLETQLGKRVVIMSQSPDNDIADKGVRIVGIYQARLQSTEEYYVYAGKNALQELLQANNLVSEIAITADDYASVDQWWPKIADIAGPKVSTEPWMTLDGYLHSMLSVQSNMNVVVMVIIFVALSFGLVNTLVMAIFERIREIGLMMALGMRPQWILYQVLLESLILLALGLIIGNSLAIVSILPLQSGIDISVVGEGLEMAGLGTTLYPTLAIEDMLMSTAIVLVLGLLASTFPAWRASRYNPVDALAKD